MERECAEAALKMIRSGMTIGLSEGRITEYLIEFLQYSNLDVKVATASMNTALLCQKHNLNVVPIWMQSSVDIAFDTCDQVDVDLNGLKTTTGMKVQDKVVAAMAKEYVLFVDEDHFVEKVSFDLPIYVEVVKEAFSFATRRIEEMGADVKWKQPTADDSSFDSRSNLILECKFSNVESVNDLNDDLLRIPGVVDTSLFIGLATTALVASKDGSIRTVNKDATCVRSECK